MEKIIVLGTGTASVIENFNTCFVLEDSNKEYLLVDTGGGNRILGQFKKANIDLTKIYNIFISHKHIDHLFGMLWIYRFVDLAMQKGTYEGVLNIYCHDEVAKIIREQIHTLLRKSQQQFIDKRIFINIVNNHEKVKILNYELEFLDIISKSDIVLWHTQENLGKDRKGCYIKEAKENFVGNVYVPNDFEEIIL